MASCKRLKTLLLKAFVHHPGMKQETMWSVHDSILLPNDHFTFRRSSGVTLSSGYIRFVSWDVAWNT